MKTAEYLAYCDEQLAKFPSLHFSKRELLAEGKEIKWADFISLKLMNERVALAEAGIDRERMIEWSRENSRKFNAWRAAYESGNA